MRDDPFWVLSRAVGFLAYASARWRKNITINRCIKIVAKPIIDIRDGCTLKVGKNVTLNSRNRGYHVNMYGPVKLFADGNGAEISIGDGTRIHGACIHASRSIRIGKNCLIAANCQIIDSHGHSLSFPDVENRIFSCGTSEPVVIEDNVWLAMNCVIMPGVTIGYGAIIGANSVVTKDVPRMCIAVGNPASVVKKFDAVEGKLIKKAFEPTKSPALKVKEVA